MPLAVNPPIQQKPLSVDEFLARYRDNNRYELIDGEVFDGEPTGPHVRAASPQEMEVAAFITAKLCVQIDQASLPWFVLQRGLLRPAGTGMSPTLSICGQWEELDIENLAEEIESSGRQERQELRNRLEVLLGHLLKWHYQPEARTKSWAATIQEQRRRIQRHLQENPSLKP